MKKSKKNSPRPRWQCKKCGAVWVSCGPVCIICGSVGIPLNGGAEKLIRKMDNESIV